MATPNLFPSGMSTSNDDPFTLVDNDANTNQDEDDMFFAKSSAFLKQTAAATTSISNTTSPTKFTSSSRRKTASLFDDDDEDNPSSSRSPQATPSKHTEPASTDAIIDDDAELEKVLAALTSPEGRIHEDPTASSNHSLPSSSAPFFASSALVNEDEFDHIFSRPANHRSSGLFDDDEDDADSKKKHHSRNTSLASISLKPLEDKLYSVFKVDEAGNKKPRRLRLTNTEFQTLQLDGTLRKAFAYSDIFCVTCPESFMDKDAMRTISISFISDSDLSFQSTEAKELSQELNDRLTRCKRLEMEKQGSSTATGPSSDLFADVYPSFAAAASNSALAQNYQQRLFASSSSSENEPLDSSIFFSPNYVGSGQQATGTRSRSSSNAASGATSKVSGATTATDKSLKSTSTVAPVPVTANVASTPTVTPSSSLHSSSAPPPSDSAARTTRRNSAYEIWHAQYVLDQKIQERIDQLWLTSTNEEYKARVKFLKAFPSMEKTPETLLLATRKFLDSFRTYMEKKRVTSLRAEVLSANLLTGAQFDSSFHARVERSAEVAILMPVLPRLLSVVSSLPTERAGDAKVAQQCAQLKGKMQEHFGIPEKHRSPSNWKHACQELLQLQKYELPADKIEVLLGTAKAIYQTYQQEAKVKAATAAAVMSGATMTTNDATTTTTPSAEPSKPTSTMFLPADDFFPIFVYVVCQTPLSKPCSLKSLMWQLSDPTQLSGEGGYYLTVFDSAVEYLKNVDVTKPMHLDGKGKKK